MGSWGVHARERKAEALAKVLDRDRVGGDSAVAAGGRTATDREHQAAGAGLGINQPSCESNGRTKGVNQSLLSRVNYFICGSEVA